MTLKIASLVRILIFASLMLAGVQMYNDAMANRSAVLVADHAASKAQHEANKARVLAEAHDYMREHGCTKTARLTDSIVVVGAKYDGAYVYDQMYILTFDEAFKAGKAGSAWILGYCG